MSQQESRQNREDYRRYVAFAPRDRRRPIIRGQDNGRWTDIYHVILTTPWWGFFLTVAGAFVAVNGAFALLYLAQPGSIADGRVSFWQAFLFSVQTMGSLNYNDMAPRTVYADVLVIFEAFFGILNLAIVTGVMYARFSRPFARVVFSHCLVMVDFDGVPTLMFRAANQRGNQILDASISVSLARQAMTREGIVMRRFEELELVRARSPLFALSWTVMHRLDERSPLYGFTIEQLKEGQTEFIVLLSGTDESLAEMVFARHTYSPDDILINRRFVDVITFTPGGRRIVDLSKFHDTVPM
ncbi:MAG: ATP-sensitive inward rectifier potassium channel 10 [Alphaproteobacteria bacterium]|nr:ATP-sensitive inward rectifier potassium channel 10 [Alphaproteobacteria bacterium]